jgi:hypothetical protein
MNDPQAAHDADDSPLRDSRSTSPAKRRASEMDSDICPPVADAADEMDLDKSTETETSKGTPASGNGSSAAVYTSSSPTEVEEESVPSLDEQVEQVRTQASQFEEKEGLPGYLISRKWLGRVIARSKYSTEMGTFDKSCLEGDIGQIDNEDILAGKLSGMLKNPV